jgi:tetratricopeptide (TPR) repeat protein
LILTNSYDGHFFYARWLRQKNRVPEAISELEKSIEQNPDYMQARYLLMETFVTQRDWLRLRAAAASTLQRFPVDSSSAGFLAAANSSAQAAPEPPVALALTADEYVNLSLAYYQTRKFDDSIKAAREALKLQPDYAAAYNNIAAAYAEMHQWERAIEAARQALKIRPDFELARNNLAWAESQQALRKK